MIIYGKNPVYEILTSRPRDIEEVYLIKQGPKGKHSDLLKLCETSKVRVKFLPKDAVTRIAETPSHQGVAAKVTEFRYTELSDVLSSRSDSKLLLVILDHIEDPQNLGAIIRTSHVLGADAVIIPKDRAANVTPAVIRASAGTAHHLPVIRVTNLRRTIEELKKSGVWIVGGDTDAEKMIHQEKLSSLDVALVVGSEGRGLSKGIRDSCDFLVSIPENGRASSLNASVAAGIILYEIVKGRVKEG